MKFLRCAAAVGLMGCAFLCGGTKADAATMKDVFDEHYYADKYPDLQAEYGYDRELLWQHYVDHGMTEGRKMNGYIDVVKYRNMYPDLNEEFGDDWDAYIDHYLTNGAIEGRRPGGEFDTLSYADISAKLQAMIEENRIVIEEQPEEQKDSRRTGQFWEQAIAEGSYGELWGLDQVDKPQMRNYEEIMIRLNELGKENELIAEICGKSFLYSEAMLRALANNPEMAGFVNGYMGISPVSSGGFSEEELALNFPLFLQWDPRWGYVSYGDDNCIGLAGCGPTCLSMALYYLTGDTRITPDSVATYSVYKGHYVPGVGTAWSLFGDLASWCGVRISEPGWSEQSFKDALDQGKVIICSMRPGDFTAVGHFIVIYGYDEAGFMINDPNCVARSMRQWTYGEFAAQIKHTWILGG